MKQALNEWFLTRSPGTNRGVPRRDTKLYSFNPQMFIQQRPPLWLMV